VMIALFGGLFGIVSQLIYGLLINPGMTEVIVQAQLQKLEEAGMNSADIENAEPMMRTMLHPAIMAGGAFIGTFIMGAIISLITAAFLKRTESVPPAAPAA